jgi:hypothetical protein
LIVVAEELAFVVIWGKKGKEPKFPPVAIAVAFAVPPSIAVAVAVALAGPSLIPPRTPVA